MGPTAATWILTSYRGLCDIASRMSLMRQEPARRAETSCDVSQECDFWLNLLAPALVMACRSHHVLRAGSYQQT